MVQRTRERSRDDRHAEQPPLTAREAADIAREHIIDLIDREPVMMTSVEPTDEGWVVEVEALEAERIPSSSDILALYEVELDADGELLAYRRIRRYLRSQTVNGGEQP